VVILDPLAHLNLFFGDDDGDIDGTEINVGHILLPTTVGGTWTVGDVFKPAGRAIITNFNVLVPDETFPPPDNQFTIFGVDQDEEQIFINNNYNVTPQ
jgi:hypothetical protein